MDGAVTSILYIYMYLRSEIVDGLQPLNSLFLCFQIERVHVDRNTTSCSHTGIHEWFLYVLQATIPWKMQRGSWYQVSWCMWSFRHGFLLTGCLVAVHRVRLLGCREQVFKGLGCFGGNMIMVRWMKWLRERIRRPLAVSEVVWGGACCCCC